MSRKTLFLILVILTGLGIMASAHVGAVDTRSSLDSNSGEAVMASGGVEYQIFFYQNRSEIEVVYENPTASEIKFAGYVVTVDGQQIHEQDFNLSEDAHKTKKINITPGINVNQDEHTVTFSTYGNSTQFNFTRKIESANASGIPTPYISNVKVADGTVKGQPSAVAEVTIVNPSKQLYSTKLFVHTEGTDGSLYPASVRPGDSRTITVELLDERGSKIAGEARLYTGNLTTKDGAMDQVEFAGQAEGETRVWNASYEPVRPTWMNNHYRYHNDSYGQSFGEKVSDGHELGGVPLAYLGVALLVGWVAVRKFR